MNNFKRKRTNKKNKKNKTKNYRGGNSEDDFKARDELLKTFQNKGALVNLLLQEYTDTLELYRILQEDPEINRDIMTDEERETITVQRDAMQKRITNIQKDINSISVEIETLKGEIRIFDTIVRDKYRVLAQRAREKREQMKQAAENLKKNPENRA
jgi:hypothetical protein